MPCFHPLEAWRGRKRGPSGKTRIVFRKEESSGVRLELPCGQCIGCRLEHSRRWAVRMMHEKSLHEDNAFITLTYSDEFVPRDGSLDVTHFQKFAKRLRKRCGPFRFFHCGEYGEQLSRPHYHAVLFGLDFADKALYRDEGGVRLYTSERLTEVWGMGHCTVGDVSFESCAYVARYVTKKVTGDRADEHYLRCDADGVAYYLKPEYVTMSRRPGLAAEWFRRFSNEVYPSDEVICRGVPSRPPRYYDSQLESSNPDLLETVKRKRRRVARTHKANNTPERLRVREAVTQARTRLFLKRRLES